MNIIVNLLLLFIIYNSAEYSSLSVNTPIDIPPEDIYTSYQIQVQKIDSLKVVGRRQTPAKAGLLFATYIDQNIIPYWIGTTWDYNGTTQIPNNGFIACGYFVTTVLRDAGVKINRVKMANALLKT